MFLVNPYMLKEHVVEILSANIIVTDCVMFFFFFFMIGLDLVTLKKRPAVHQEQEEQEEQEEQDQHDNFLDTPLVRSMMGGMMSGTTTPKRQLFVAAVEGIEELGDVD